MGLKEPMLTSFHGASLRRRCSTGRFVRAGAATALCLLGGCTVGPDFEKPSWAAPASWFSGPRQQVMKVSARTLSVTNAEPVDVEWWSLFDDPTLTALMRRV